MKITKSTDNLKECRFKQASRKHNKVTNTNHRGMWIEQEEVLSLISCKQREKQNMMVYLCTC